jgi:hypothetical protein
MKKLSIKLINSIKETWHKQGERILVLFALILVALVSFNAGQTHEKAIKSAEISMTINESSSKIAQKEQEVKALGEALERKGLEIPQESATDKKIANAEEKDCALVGSKNSDKYHLPTCQWASRIKQENRVCFSSVEDAQNQGYEPAKCCNK